MRAQNGNRQMRDVWELRGEQLVPQIFELGSPKTAEKSYGKHPTQKPEALLERIILSFLSKEGERELLDPFSGSGTTGVVAVKVKRRYIGIEFDLKYLELSKKRLTAAGRDITLDFQ